MNESRYIFLRSIDNNISGLNGIAIIIRNYVGRQRIWDLEKKKLLECWKFSRLYELYWLNCTLAWTVPIIRCCGIYRIFRDSSQTVILI